jgi:hypothetical protein
MWLLTSWRIENNFMTMFLNVLSIAAAACVASFFWLSVVRAVFFLCPESYLQAEFIADRRALRARVGRLFWKPDETGIHSPGWALLCAPWVAAGFIALMFAHPASYHLAAGATIQYAGGTNVNALCTGVSGTKQELASCVEDAMNTAGWTTNSGHHSLPTALQSATTPTAGLNMIVVLSAGTNCVIFKVQNVAGTHIATTGVFLLPGIGKIYRNIIDKYQAFISLDGSAAARGTIGFGVPFVPTFTGITECIWALGVGVNDTDTGINASWKSCPNLNASSNCTGANSSTVNSFTLLNGTQIENVGGVGANQIGFMSLWLPTTANLQFNTQSQVRWFDGSYPITDPVFGFSNTSINTEGRMCCLLWDAAWINAAIPSETALTFDSHNWLEYTNNNSGVASVYIQGGLALVVP